MDISSGARRKLRYVISSPLDVPAEIVEDRLPATPLQIERVLRLGVKDRGHLGSSARLLEYGGMIAIAAVSVFAAISAAEPVPGLHFAVLNLPFL